MLLSVLYLVDSKRYRNESLVDHLLVVLLTDGIGFDRLPIVHARLGSCEVLWMVSESNWQNSFESSGLEARFVEDLMRSIADSGIGHLCLGEDH